MNWNDELNKEYFPDRRKRSQVADDIEAATRLLGKAKLSGTQVEIAERRLQLAQLKAELADVIYEEHTDYMMYMSRTDDEYFQAMREKIELHSARLAERQEVEQAKAALYLAEKDESDAD